MAWGLGDLDLDDPVIHGEGGWRAAARVAFTSSQRSRPPDGVPSGRFGGALVSLPLFSGALRAGPRLPHPGCPRWRRLAVVSRSAFKPRAGKRVKAWGRTGEVWPGDEIARWPVALEGSLEGAPAVEPINGGESLRRERVTIKITATGLAEQAVRRAGPHHLAQLPPTVEGTKPAGLGGEALGEGGPRRSACPSGWRKRLGDSKRMLACPAVTQPAKIHPTDVPFVLRAGPRTAALRRGFRRRRPHPPRPRGQ